MLCYVMCMSCAPKYRGLPLRSCQLYTIVVVRTFLIFVLSHFSASLLVYFLLLLFFSSFSPFPLFNPPRTFRPPVPETQPSTGPAGRTASASSDQYFYISDVPASVSSNAL